MKKFALSLILIFCLVLSAKAFSPNAYVYVLPTFQKTSPFVKELSNLVPGSNSEIEDYVFNNLVRLRVRPEIKLIDNVFLKFHYEVNANYTSADFGNFTINNLDGINQGQAVKLNWQLHSDEHLQINHYFDRLYLHSYFDWGELSLGRQRISWGTGRIWQPTDLFNPINPANFSKFEKDGADVAMAKIYLGNFSDIDLVYNFTDDLDRANLAAKYRSNFSGNDFSIMTGYFNRNYVLGGEFATGFKGIGLRAEAIFFAADDNFDDNFLRFILGADYQFTDKLYGLVEYQFNGEGFSNTSEYELLRLAAGEILVLNRNYIFLQSAYRITELLTLNASHLQNINDGSYFSGIAAIYSVSNEVSLTLSSQLFGGSEATEFWYFPTSVFLLGQYYF